MTDFKDDNPKQNGPAYEPSVLDITNTEAPIDPDKKGPKYTIPEFCQKILDNFQSSPRMAKAEIAAAKTLVEIVQHLFLTVHQYSIAQASMSHLLNIEISHTSDAPEEQGQEMAATAESSSHTALN